MRKRCAVVSCRTNSDLQSVSVRFFPFPQNPQTRRKWIYACENPMLDPKTAIICELHFKDIDYQSGNQNILLTDAVPTTSIFDPLLEVPVEFLEIPENNEKLCKDSAVQCNLFEENFNQEFENYSNNFKFSIDEIAKLMGITIRTKLNCQNDEIRIKLETDSDEILTFNLNSEENQDFIVAEKQKIKKVRKPPRDLSKQNFILLPNNGGFQCEICDKICLKLAAYYAHRDSHLEYSTICTRCGYNSTTYKQARVHEKICSDLKVTNDTETNEKISKIISRKPEKRDTTCYICDYKFGKYVTYMDHMNVHNNIKPYRCSCLRNYSHYSNFLQHVLKHKCPVEGRIVAEYAPQGLAPKNNFEYPNNSKRFYCPMCNKYFHRMKYLIHFSESKHIENEKIWIEKFNINKFQCIYCKNYKEYDYLLDCINHCRKIHHKMPNSQFFKAFENQSIPENNKLIKNIQHKTIQNSVEYKKLIESSQIRSKQKYCSICDKYFIKRISFLDHTNIHDNTYPYICPCGVKLRFYEEILKHIRRYQCKGKIIFPDYAPQTFAKSHNSMYNTENVKLDKNEVVNSNEVVSIEMQMDDGNIEIRQ